MNSTAYRLPKSLEWDGSNSILSSSSQILSSAISNILASSEFLNFNLEVLRFYPIYRVTFKICDLKSVPCCSCWFFFILPCFLVYLVFCSLLASFWSWKNLRDSLRLKEDVPALNQVLSMKLLFQLKSWIQTGCKSVSVSLWPQLSPFSFSPGFSAWLWEAFSFVPWTGGGGAALALVCSYTESEPFRLPRWYGEDLHGDLLR